MSEFVSILQNALRFRASDCANYFSESHDSALRLFNGFLEGCPGLVVELYGSTLVLFINDPADEIAGGFIPEMVDYYRVNLPWLKSGILKNRSTGKNQLIFGSDPDKKIRENGIWYAIDLFQHQDSTFYLDTRFLRYWVKDNLAGKSVLNTFAYTCSLGAAAFCGGASKVLNTDLDQYFLNLGMRTFRINGWQVNSSDFLAGDFFKTAAGLKRKGSLFDCIILDPPLFSVTKNGRFDLNYDYYKLINKIRPLVAHGGVILAVNNAIFVSGKDHMRWLQDLCADGFLEIGDIIPVPPDITGLVSYYGTLPADPYPFNHSTKMIVLKVLRKDKRTSNQ